MQHINYNEFIILRLKLLHKNIKTQRSIVEHCNLSLGLVNCTLSQLKSYGFLDHAGEITDSGRDILSSYQVDNAIIMAAGMSSRFAPLSYDKPKGLLQVKGEILIERQIRQLQEAGISNIIVVLGYMKEQFFYLEKKFNIKIVINEDYYRYNNTSTLMSVLSDIKNSYICSSDNYYVENPFYPYEYKSYYPVAKGADYSTEYYVKVGSHNRITNITIGKGEHYLIGYAYFDHTFSEKFIKILKDEYQQVEVKKNLWEKILINHLDVLDITAHVFDDKKIQEFDSLSDLQKFDPYYIKNTDSKILENIIKVMKCKIEDITNIVPLKEGMTNLSFSFEVNDQKYVYRHPGFGTEAYIDRKAEYSAQKIAKKYHLDDSFIYMDPKEGWKISSFIKDAHLLDYDNLLEVEIALKKIKSLHDMAITENCVEFDIWKKTQNYFDNINKKGRANFEGLDNLAQDMQKLHQITESRGVEKVLCHCDLFNTNILFNDTQSYIIDWEYSGIEDPAIDVGIFIASSNYSYDEVLEILKIYNGEDVPIDRLKHFIAYVALSAYYCFAWALYQDSRGAAVGEYLYIWYKYAVFYGEKALQLYEQ